jgi:hypothetical protein
MNQYRVTVRIDGLRGVNPAEVRSAVEARLAKAEVEDCRVLAVEEVNVKRGRRPPAPPRVAPAPDAWRRQSNAGGVILLIAMGWAGWVLWSFVSLYFATE